VTEKLRRIALCVQRLCRGAEVTESFEDSKRSKLRRSSIFIRAGENSSHGARRGKGAKVEAFGNLEFFQVQEESAKAQEEYSCHRIQSEDLDRWSFPTSRKQ
jgi:hypothetical protein